MVYQRCHSAQLSTDLQVKGRRSKSVKRRRNLPSTSKGSLVGRGLSSPSSSQDQNSRRDIPHGGNSPAVSEYDEPSATRRLYPSRRRRSTSGSLDEQTRSFAPITLQFNFTGSAIYLFGFETLSTTHIRPSINVTFSIDGVPYLQATRPSQPSTELRSNVTLFSQNNLPEGPHSLAVTVGAESEFIFDYLIYTQSRTLPQPNAFMAVPSPATTSPTGSPITTSPPSDSTSAGPDKKRNVTTFAAAVGGSVGVLAVLSTGLAASIIRRRYLAAKREREEREADPHDPERIRQQQMAMAGPDVFIPRFFPGTEIPPGDLPPPYNDAINTPPPTPSVQAMINANTISTHIPYPYLLPMQSPYLHNPYPHQGMRSPSELSYADVPPDSPPPPSELALSDDPHPHQHQHHQHSVHPPRTPPPPPFPAPRPLHVDVGVGAGGSDDEMVPRVPSALGLVAPEPDRGEGAVPVQPPPGLEEHHQHRPLVPTRSRERQEQTQNQGGTLTSGSADLNLSHGSGDRNASSTSRIPPSTPPAESLPLLRQISNPESIPERR